MNFTFCTLINFIFLAFSSGLVSCDNGPETSIAITAQNQQPIATHAINTTSAIAYISTDKGNTWQPFADGLPEEATVSCFAEKGNTLFVTTRKHGVYKRTVQSDWINISLTLPTDLLINPIVVMDNTLIIGTHRHGIWISTDEGKTWKHTASDLDKIAVRCLVNINKDLFAGTDQGLYKSVDSGKTWKHVYGNSQVNGFTTLQDKVYMAAVGGALVSRDKGAHWQHIYQPHILHDISSDAAYIYAMTMGDGLLKSKDDGLNWENIDDGLDPQQRYTFEVQSAGHDLFAAQWTGLFHSGNGGQTWQRISTGLPEGTAFTTLAVTDWGIVAAIGLRE